jgi:hypothetical protein
MRVRGYLTRRRRRLVAALSATVALVAAGAGTAGAGQTAAISQAGHAVAGSATTPVTFSSAAGTTKARSRPAAAARSSAQPTSVAPTVTLSMPAVQSDECPSTTCLPSDTIVFLQSGNSSAPVTVNATVSAGAPVGTTINCDEVALQVSPAGSGDWTEYTPRYGLGLSGSGGVCTGDISYFNFPPGIQGLYDLRVQVTDSARDTGVSQSVANVVVDDDQTTPYVPMESPGRTLHGSVTLLAAPEANAVSAPQSVAFQIKSLSLSSGCAPVDATIGSGSAGGTTYDGEPEFQVPLDTTGYCDGTYELSDTAQGSGGPYVGNVTTVTIGNTPPAVTLINPGTSLSGVAELQATATSSLGVASVKFQYARAGTGNWSTIGVASAPSSTSPAPLYTVSFDTRGIANGVYDLRAVATDSADQTSTSDVSGVSVANAAVTGASPGSLTVTDSDVPATDITVLGELDPSADHETWAYGYSTAQVDVGDLTLPDTATPRLLLLRYTDESGWQIADVLRNADGTAPAAIPAGTRATPVPVTGQMTASGEAWIVVGGDGFPVSVFHRLPGGHFLLDQPATDTLGQQFLSGPGIGEGRNTSPQLHLGQGADGSVYGVLAYPGQPVQTVTSPSGVSYSTAIEYAQLQCASPCVPDSSTDGTWTVENAPDSQVPDPQIPTNYQPLANDTLTLEAASPSGPGAGWAVFGVGSGNTNAQPLMLGSFSASSPGSGTPAWTWDTAIGLDALDLTGGFADGSALQVDGEGILYADDEVWVEAGPGTGGSAVGNVVALVDPASGRVAQSWCDPTVVAQSADCAHTIDADDPATLPAAVFPTSQGPEGLALGAETVDVYAHGAWTPVAAPGFDASGGSAVFADPTDGWLAGADAVGQIAAQAPPSPLTQWPEANQATLVSAALPPAGAGTGTSGALAVGLDGAALHYDAANGWLVDPVPTEARAINLLGVAYDGSSQAFAVGQLGTILDWNGTSWSEDPQSTTLTQDQLNAVAFAGDGQGWAVGTFGTILHYDAGTWSPEQIDPLDAIEGVDVTSVAVAGNQVYAVAGGNLIMRNPDGSWQRVDPSSQLPSDLPAGSLTLVSGLPDGGVVAAGDSVVLVPEPGTSPVKFTYSDQPIQGTAVALTAYRDPSSGQLRAFVSVAPPVLVETGSGTTVPENTAGFPAGDGELLMQTADGWRDLSRAQYAESSGTGPFALDGAPEPDPVLAVAAASDGSAAWVVGGYAGTQTAAGLGTTLPLQSRAFAWQTSSIWRYDQGGSASPPTLSQTQISLPAQPNTVSFAYFSGAECVSECSQVQNAQPDVNLAGAAGEIADFAGQPGGPAFAMLGGNAVGPSDLTSFNDGDGAVDLANLRNYLSPLGSVPLYAAFGPLDEVPTAADPAQPWDDAFAQSPAPFGLGATPAGITPVSSGGTDESVNHYYAYDVAQNGGTLRVIVLDNSAGSLDASEPGQTAWLSGQLAAAQTAGVPVVVMASQPLDSGLTGSSSQAGSATDANTVASMLANAGVLAVFTTSPTQSDQMHMIPYQNPDRPATGAAQIPEYEGASLGYQQTQNNGVLWYFISVDTATRTLSVQGVPVITSLALEPLDGLNAARSSTLSFRGVGRRPAGTLPVTVSPSSFLAEGLANYVTIPSSSCVGCVSPSYTFTSSNPAIGNFVTPSAPGSQYPKLSATGKTSASSTSGLFCAFNAGQTTVSVTSGLLTSSLTVTVAPGDIGQPCGTVTYAPDENVVTIQSKPELRSSVDTNGGLGAGAQPPVKTNHVTAPIGRIGVPPPVPVPVPVTVVPAPVPVSKPPLTKPVHQPVVQQSPPLAVGPPSSAAFYTALPAIVLPPIPPPITPVPPGGATAPAQGTAKREEKARKHASQSAFVIRPAGTPADEWFFPAVGTAGVLTLLLLAAGARPGPRRKPALLTLDLTDDHRYRRRNRP